MTSPPNVLRRIRALFGRQPVEADVRSELAGHLDAQTQRFVAAGMTPDAARRAALVRFGDLGRIRDECVTIAHQMEGDMRRAELAQELRQDVTYALRTLRRSPLFTLVALLTLAIGIGANTAIFSVVDAVLLKGLPYRNADRAIVIWNSYAASGLEKTSIAPAEFADILEQQRSLDGVAAITRQTGSLTGGCPSGSACDAERVVTYPVSPNLFVILGATPRLGRDFVPDDVRADAPRVIMLSDALWRRRFGGDPSIVGRTVTLNGRLRTVVGVMPSDVKFPDAPLGFLRERADVWIPANWVLARSESRGNQYLGVVARAKPGVPLARVQSDLDAIAAGFRATYSDRYAGAALGWRIIAVPMLDEMVGSIRRGLLVLLGAVGMVLLIACANVANLMLARGATRRRELAIRTALGAGRARLIRQLLTESSLLAIGGGVLGAGLAYVGVSLLVRLDPGSIPRLDGASIDGRVLAFSLALALFTGLVFGLAPALQQSGGNVQTTLKDGGSAGRIAQPRRRLRSLLVVAEVAMALVVLVGAGLLVRSFAALQRVTPGFDARDVVAFQLSVPRAKYDSVSKVVAYERQVMERLRALPGADAASAVYPLPMSGDRWSGSFIVETQPVAPGQPEPHSEYAVSMPGYMQTMRIPILAGRDFSSEDVPNAPEVVIVDEVLAKRYWPGESAVGKRVNVVGRAEGIWATVVGVVAHVHNEGPHVAGEPQIYLPALQRPQSTLSFVTRGANAQALASSIRTAIRSIDADVPVAKLASMSDVVDGAVARQRFNMLLLAIFAAAALALAAVGLYGVMAYLVTQRVHEIGIRLALGSQQSRVLALVVGEGLAMTFAGLGIGLVAALLLSRAMSGLLYGVTASDPLTYAAIGGMLVVVSFVASYLPARRATKIDPIVALRSS